MRGGDWKMFTFDSTVEILDWLLRLEESIVEILN